MLRGFVFGAALFVLGASIGFGAARFQTLEALSLWREAHAGWNRCIAAKSLRDVDLPVTAADTVDVTPIRLATPPTRDALMEMLRGVPKDLVLLVGYKGDDGDIHALSQADLCSRR